jgi:hypothetical protein
MYIKTYTSQIKIDHKSNEYQTYDGKFHDHSRNFQWTSKIPNDIISISIGIL